MTTDPRHGQATLAVRSGAAGENAHSPERAPPGCLRPIAGVPPGRELEFRRLGRRLVFEGFDYGAAGFGSFFAGSFFAGAAGLAGLAPLPAGASLKNSALALRICLKLASEIT